jgi:phosphoglucosamine mutase
MTNYGFHRSMEDLGIEVETTPVGDRHVSRALGERGWNLGGEQSGHLIWAEHAPTGDGIAAALLVMAALDGRDLAAAIPMERLPQVLVNVEVADRDSFAASAAVREEIEREGAALEGRGRVLVRPSGTEPLVRVMVEAPTEAECTAAAERIALAIRRDSPAS